MRRKVPLSMELSKSRRSARFCASRTRKRACERSREGGGGGDGGREREKGRKQGQGGRDRERKGGREARQSRQVMLCLRSGFRHACLRRSLKGLWAFVCVYVCACCTRALVPRKVRGSIGARETHTDTRTPTHANPPCGAACRRHGQACGSSTPSGSLSLASVK